MTPDRALPDIASNIEVIRERIARAAERSGRDPSAVTIVAVTKTVPVPRILAALDAGVTDFGENRVQEAESKFAFPSRRQTTDDGRQTIDDRRQTIGRQTTRHTVVRRLSSVVQSTHIQDFELTPTFHDLVPRQGITLHMIGSLQRNKARDAARFFDTVHSLDRLELAQALERAVSQETPGRKLPVLVEVNSTGEATKSGVTPEALPDLARAVADCPHLELVGLMTIARLGADEPELHRTFAGMRRLLESLQTAHPTMRHLSMGMTDDYEIAVEEGATLVRIGRAIFGPRDFRF